MIKLKLEVGDTPQTVDIPAGTVYLFDQEGYDDVKAQFMDGDYDALAEEAAELRRMLDEDRKEIDRLEVDAEVAEEEYVELKRDLNRANVKLADSRKEGDKLANLLLAERSANADLRRKLRLIHATSEL